LQDGARRDDVVNGTSSVGISEVGSSGMVTQDTPIYTSDCLGSSSQANASLGNLETGNFYSILSQFLLFEMYLQNS